MAKEFLSNLPVPGSVTALSTLESELKTGENTAHLVTLLELKGGYDVLTLHNVEEATFTYIAPGTIESFMPNIRLVLQEIKNEVVLIEEDAATGERTINR